MQTQKLRIPLGEKLKSLTGIFGLHLTEQPSFKLLKEDGDFELREYAPMFVAKVSLPGPFEVARDEAFIKLAKYVYGENRPRRILPMTTPILMELARAEGQHRLTMSFILPSDENTKTYPTPLNSEIHFQKIPEQTWAVVSYSGKNTPQQMDQKSQELQSWLMANGHKALTDKTLVVAQYDGPGTIPFLRRNEIWLQLWSDDLH